MDREPMYTREEIAAADTLQMLQSVAGPESQAAPKHVDLKGQIQQQPQAPQMRSGNNPAFQPGTQAHTSYVLPRPHLLPAPVKQQQPPQALALARQNHLYLPLHLRQEVIQAQPQVLLPGLVSCAICQQVCSSKYALAQHHVNEHAADINICEFYGMGPYRAEANLNRHKLAKHTPQSEWTC